MAYVKYKDGTTRNLSPKQGIAIWNALQNPSNLSEAQLEKLANISGLWLNWRNPDTPDDYIKEHLDTIIPIVLGEWKVDRYTGKPLRPETDFAWRFSKRWGLWEHGKPSVLVTGQGANVFPTSS